MDPDRTDFILVGALQKNASLRLEDLGRLVKMSPSAVHERLRRLEDGGVIRRWTIECDAALLGLGVLAFIGIRASRPCSELRPALEGISEIEECHSIAGAKSMLLKVRVRSTVELLSLTDRLRQLPAIEETETTIVLATQFDRPFQATGAEPVATRAKPKR